MAEKLKQAGIVLVFLIGGIGGGVSISNVLEHFQCPSLLVNVLALVYWCTYGMLFAKIEFRPDKKRDYDRGYQDGYAAAQRDLRL